MYRQKNIRHIITTALLLMLTVGIGVCADKPKYKFASGQSHNFGAMVNDSTATKVSHDFLLVNRSKTVPLVIINALCPCKCTSVDYPHRPIEVGDTARITVTYDPRGQELGGFHKYIRVVMRDVTTTEFLQIKGKIKSKLK